MTHYSPAPTVLPAFTDEALHAGTGYRGEVADLLLSIPAEYRQQAAVEQRRRSGKTVQTGGEAVRVRVRASLETWREVVAEVTAQMAGAR